MSPLLVSCAVAVIAGNAPLLLMFCIGSASKRVFTIDLSVMMISWAFGVAIAIVSRAKGWA